MLGDVSLAPTRQEGKKPKHRVQARYKTSAFSTHGIQPRGVWFISGKARLLVHKAPNIGISAGQSADLPER